ncbi:hypothetical protein CSIV_15510 [Microbacterium sp. CSI-V]|uniref:ApeA N-terminal domain 1-containing protein n=1 Tax=unclassified Microbacterium TaxID=2609290 RepID=UPI00097BC6D3|nr:hypothetical protein [Microbacterium sp. TL13]ONI62852.1 hypothetical protein CSIV_15510 [Microbacterium sp. CSI-V]
MDDATLDEAQEWSGQWWLPDETDALRSGVLYYEPERGLTLRTVGGWSTRIRHVFEGGGLSMDQGRRGPIPVIHGRAEGKQVTLLHVESVNARGIDPSTWQPSAQVLEVQTALVGCHLGGEDEQEFIAGTVFAEHLTAWSGLGGMQLNYDLKDEGKAFSGSGNITIAPTTPLEAALDGAKAKLSLVHTLPHGERTRGGLIGRVTEQAKIEYTPDEP